MASVRVKPAGESSSSSASCDIIQSDSAVPMTLGQHESNKKDEESIPSTMSATAGLNDDINEMWGWLCRPFPKSSYRDDAKEVCRRLKHSYKQKPKATGTLTPASDVAEQVLRRAEQMNHENGKGGNLVKMIPVWLRLLRLPWSCETSWKAVSGLLQCLFELLEQQQEQQIAHSSLERQISAISMELQAFWQQAVPLACQITATTTTIEIKVESVTSSSNSSSDPSLPLSTQQGDDRTPRHFILMEWIPALTREIQTPKRVVEEMENVPQQLLLALIRCLSLSSSTTDSETNTTTTTAHGELVSAALDQIFLSSSVSADHDSSWLLPFAESLLGTHPCLLRPTDWMACFDYGKECLQRTQGLLSSQSAVASMPLYQLNGQSAFVAYHMTRLFILGLQSSMLMVEEERCHVPEASPKDDSDSDGSMYSKTQQHRLGVEILTLLISLVKLDLSVATGPEKRTLSAMEKAISELSCSLYATNINNVLTCLERFSQRYNDGPNVKEEEIGVLLCFVVLILTWSRPTDLMLSFNSLGVVMLETDGEASLSENPKCSTTDLVRPTRSFWNILDQVTKATASVVFDALSDPLPLLAHIAYKGEGNFVKRPNSHCKDIEGLCSYMTRLGRIVWIALKQFPLPNTDVKTMWMAILHTAWNGRSADNQSHDLFSIVSVVTTILIEHPSSWSFRTEWLKGLKNFLCEQSCSHHDSRLSLDGCMGSLYLLNDYLDNNAQQNSDQAVKIYHQQLLNLLVASKTPSQCQQTVLAILPQTVLRDSLFQHACCQWLRCTGQDIDSFSKLYRSSKDPDYDDDDIRDNARLALWTLLQVIWGNNSEDRMDHFLRPICRFIVERSPPVSLDVRSWFFERAISNVITHLPLNRIEDATSQKVLWKLVRSLMVRFFQLTEHHQKTSSTKVKEWHCGLSLDRIFIRVDQSAVPCENVAAIFCQLNRLIELLLQSNQPDCLGFTQKWHAELIGLLGLEELLNVSDTQPLASSGNPTVGENSSSTSEALALCARIVIHFAAKGRMVDHKCSFKKIRASLCADDNLLAQSNADTQKYLACGEIPPDLSQKLTSQLRRDLIDGLIRALLSSSYTSQGMPPNDSNASSSTGILESVCALSVLKEDIPKSNIENCSSSSEYLGLFANKIFPRFLSLSLPVLSSILTSQKPGLIESRETCSASLEVQHFGLILSSLVIFCRGVTSLATVTVLPHNETLDFLFHNLGNLYDTFCSKMAFDTLTSYLEKRCLDKLPKELFGLKSILTGVETAVDVDRVARNARQDILRSIQTCLSVLQTHAQPFTCVSGRTEGQHKAVFVVVKHILGQCARDLREGLEGANGGLSTEEYQSYMECMESACQCISTIYAKHLKVEQMGLILSTSATVASLAEDIVCSIAMQNSSIFRRTLHLYLRTIPAVVECTIREAYLAGFQIQIPQKLSRGPTSFEQCIEILKGWSQSSRALWTSTVNPGHLRATRFGGDAGDSDGRDDSFEERTITFVDKGGENKCKQELQPLLQLESDRAWTWAFSTVFDANGTAVEDSLLGILRSEERNLFPSDDDMAAYIVHRVGVLREVMQQSKLVLSTGGTLGETLALSLPQTTKAAFRNMLEQIVKALSQALEILCCDSSKGSAEWRDCRLAESLAWSMTWIYDTDAGIDFCHGICLWSSAEARVADRLKRGKNIHVSDNKNTVGKRLERLVVGARDMEGILDKLCSAIRECTNGKFEALTDIWSKAACRLNVDKTMEEALALKVKYLQQQRSLHGEKLYRSGSSSTRGRSQKKRRAPSSGHTAVRRSRKEITSQSRNNLVRSWLQKDREVGKEEKYEEDAYADLEDFLVDG